MVRPLTPLKLLLSSDIRPILAVSMAIETIIAGFIGPANVDKDGNRRQRPRIWRKWVPSDALRAARHNLPPTHLQTNSVYPRGWKFKANSRFFPKMLKFKVNSRCLEDFFGIQGFQGSLRSRGCSDTHAACSVKIILKCTWEHTLERNHINATNVTRLFYW